MQQSNDLEICPRSLTVVSPESCRVAMYVKCSEDSERMKRKSPFSTTPFSIDAPSPANPREYLHKPYTVRNYVPWAIFLSLIVYVALQMFEQFCPKAGDTNPLVAETETDFNAKWQFKVIYSGIIEETLMGYVAQYNKCGLRCEDSEDIASERSENLHFRPTHSFDAPSPANPREYLHKTYLARN